MKLLIDIPEEDYKFIKDLQNLIIGSRGSYKTIQYDVINAIKNGISCEEPAPGEYVGEWAKGFHEGFNAGTMLAEVFSEGTPILTEGDLISRSELKKVINDFYDSHFIGVVPNELITYANAVDTAIDIAPTVAERPQGEWEESHIFSCGNILQMGADVIEHKCKNCGRWSIKWVRTIPDNFCSYCGAEIRKGSTE